MAEQTLKITLTADNTNALSGLKQMVSSLESVQTVSQTSAKVISASFEKVGNASTDVAQRLAFPAEAARKAQIELSASLDKMEADFNQKWSNAGKSVDAVTPKIKTLQQQVSFFGGGVNKFTIAKELASIVPAANAAGAAVAKAGNYVKQNTTLWMNLGRVVQDAPYGFNGIANNLTQLIPAAGALGFAFSALVTAITFSSVGFGAWTRSAGGTKKAADQLANSIGSLNDVNNEANKQAGEQVTAAKSLYEAATNLNNPISERIKYAKELKAEFPAILANTTAEAIANGTAKVSYDELTKSIIANARAKAAAGKISELETQKMIAEDNVLKIQAVTAREIANAKGYNTGGEASETVSAAREREMISKRRDIALAKENANIKSLTIQQEYLAKSVGKVNIANSFLTAGSTKTGEKLTDLQKIYKTLSEELLKNKTLLAAGLITEGAFNVNSANAYTKALEGLAQNGISPLSDQFQSLIEKQKEFLSQSSIRSLGRQDLSFLPQEAQAGSQTTQSVSTNETATQRVIAYAKATSLAKGEQDLFNSSVKTTEQIMSVLGPEVDGLFDALLKGQSIGQALGKVFTDLATQIAKAAIKAALFQAILSVIPGGALGSAAGSAKNGGGFFGAFKKLLGFAGGGVASGPKSGYPVMLHGTEAIFNGGQLKNLVNNVSSRTMAGMRNMGNGGDIAAQIGELKTAIANNQPTYTLLPFMKGADMNILINRTQQQTQRNY